MLEIFLDTVGLTVLQVTMLAEIDIPDFDSVINNFKCAFKQQYMRRSNPVVRQLVTCVVVCVLIFCWSSHVSAVLGYNYVPVGLCIYFLSVVVCPSFIFTVLLVLCTGISLK